MYGRHIDTLNVLTQYSSGNETLIWSLKGNQGNKWKKNVLNIDSDISYSIIFEAVRGIDYEVCYFSYF
jgi:hypothetical protein